MERETYILASARGSSFGKRLLWVSLGSLAFVLGTIAAASAALGDMGRFTDVFGEVAFVPVLIGFLFLTMGILLVIYGRREKRYQAEARDHLQTVVGKIGEINMTRFRGVDKTRTRHYVYVNYSFNGVNYDHVLYPYYNPGMSEGDYIELTIDPWKPGEIARRDGSALLVIMGVLFVLSALMAVALSIGMMYWR